jgi:hypothetical protein
MQILKNIILIIISISIYSQDSVIWSSYQGKKKWIEAKNHCHSMNMRLPTISDLMIADKAGTTNGWKKNGSLYWSNNNNSQNNNSTYLAFSILATYDWEKKEVHNAESELGVYCANGSEKDDLYGTEIEYFSKFIGRMPWDRANEECKSLGMRLPTLKELRIAKKLGIMKSWEAFSYDDGYWSSTPYDAEEFYKLSVYVGITHSDRRSIYGNVRCRR